jgi:hypothetical protein
MTVKCFTFFFFQYVSLKCLASLALRRRGVKLVAGQVPSNLLTFYSRHLWEARRKP